MPPADTSTGPASSPDPLRVALVGAGAWGRRWASTLALCKRVTPAAVVDRERSAAADVARSFAPAVPCFGSVDELARAGPPIDAVVVVVPTEEHAGVVCGALGAGWHCLVEKPVAHSVAAAHDMMSAAATVGRVVTVSHNYRCGAAAGTVRRLVGDGIIGRIGQVWVDYRADMPFDGFMLDIDEPLIGRYLIHLLDLCRWVLGMEFVRLRAGSWNPSWSRFAGNSSAAVELHGSDGAVVVLRGSWSSPGRPTSWDGCWDLDGERGALRWHHDDVTVRLAHPFGTADVPATLHRGDHLQALVPPQMLSRQATMLERFVTTVRNGGRADPDLGDGLSTLQLLIAALVSARSAGALVDIAEAASSARLGPAGLLSGGS